MEQYFKDVVSELSIDDMQLLSFLYDNDATLSFKAIRNNDAANKCGFSEATFRKVMYRLIASKFVGNVTMQRSHSIFITQYGIAAIKKSLLSEEVSA